MHKQSVNCVLAAREFERVGRLLRSYAEADPEQLLYLDEANGSFRDAVKLFDKIQRSRRPRKRRKTTARKKKRS